MQALAKKERVINFLTRKSIDRIPIYENFWAETCRNWSEMGYCQGDIVSHFDFDIHEAAALTLVAGYQHDSTQYIEYWRRT